MLRMLSPFENIFDEMWNETSFLPHSMSFPTNVMEDSDSYTIEMAVPGLKRRNFSLKVSNGKLLLRVHKGRRFRWPWQRHHTYIRMERHLQLPANVDAKHVSARLANGVLCVSLPKRQSYIGGSANANHSQTRQIAVA